MLPNEPLNELEQFIEDNIDLDAIMEDAVVEDERDQCLAKLAGMKVETWVELSRADFDLAVFISRIVAEYNNMMDIQGGLTAEEM